MLRETLAAAFGLISLAALGYASVALWRLLAFNEWLTRYERSAPPSGPSPGITILKPVAEASPDLRADLRSFCAQDYPQFQVVFGVPDPDSPAVGVIDALAAEFAHGQVVRVSGGPHTAPNPKIAQLMNMVGSATYDVVVVADADTRVGPTYLHALASAFAGERVGAVTCAYRGVPQEGLASALGALMINDQFIPSVLVAALGRVRFCLGATMGVTRAALNAIGGFAALAPYLADDQMLGELVGRQGFRVALAPYVVEHAVAEPGLASLWSHELRWARTSRAARPAGYAGYFLTFAWPPALIFLLLSARPALGAVLLALALVLRLAVHYAARAALRVRTRDALWLLPLRDLMGLCEWAVTFCGRRVRWGDRHMRIDAQGRIIEPTP
ncbi:MAG TPA: bacteriohopanetetrol glucosamine biosynthesis glycosyltransferase HpnI [Candidatus Eremiobacteraceae bacterium]|nr:bacteriohopanetetrol glucosamine biosynthesis glycosyltransferase HpnI [Candidatus Eremiobacteraceae bacterium]